MASIGSPGTGCPCSHTALCSAVSAGNGNCAVICPVYKVSRRHAVDGSYIIAVFLHVAVGIILERVICGINIQSAVVYHPAGVSAETLGNQGVVLPVLFKACRSSYTCKQLFHSHCINRSGFNRELLDFTDQIALDQYCVCYGYFSILVYISSQLCVAVGNSLDQPTSFQSKICAVNAFIKVQVATDYLFAFSCTFDDCTCYSADGFIHIEVVGAVCGFNIQLHIGCICRNLVVGVAQLDPLALDGFALCHSGILGISVGVRILELHVEGIHIPSIRKHNICTEAILAARLESTAVKGTGCTVPGAGSALYQQGLAACISSISAGGDSCGASAGPFIRFSLIGAVEVPAVFVRLHYRRRVPVPTLIIKKVDVCITAGGLGGIAVNAAAITGEQLQIISHTQGVPQLGPAAAVIGIIKVRLILIIGGIQIAVHRIEEEVNFQIYFIPGHRRLCNDFVIAVRHCGRAGITAVLRHIHLLFSAVGHIDADIAILELESGQTGIVSGLHAAGIQLDNSGTVRSLRALGQGIPGIQQIGGKGLIGQPQPACALRYRPCRIVRIMVPLPEQPQLVAAVVKVIIPGQESTCVVPFDLKGHRHLAVHAHHRPVIFPGYRNQHRDSSD